MSGHTSLCLCSYSASLSFFTLIMNPSRFTICKEGEGRRGRRERGEIKKMEVIEEGIQIRGDEL